MLVVPLPPSDAAGDGGGSASSSRRLAIVSECGRQGSRAQQQVTYLDPLRDLMFTVDHEKQECTGAVERRQSVNVSAEVDGIDEKLSKPFKIALEVELDRYITERYGERSGGSSSSSSGAAASAVHVFKGKEVGGSVGLNILISSRQARPRGLWAGAWSSNWRVSFKPGQAEPVKLAGMIEFTTHYSEDGNVQFKRTAKPRAAIQETMDPGRFALAMVAAIRGLEDKFHEATEVHCETFGEESLKSLRRVLPLSKERFDWRPLRHALVRDMKAIGKEGGS
ncbi:unnamed protein product [Polarella glacialis]|uniref:F-actin-capping protein subunit alpha n=1 Tax=Polarella glacialis TaxID=89957 RepID=A0A813KUT6_POLGL|nr:unnamed protein product [Polarella glacialis]CAE8710954.1 unnamed protein product [Polarella glacialis]